MLFQKINQFYQAALLKWAQTSGYYMPDEPDNEVEEGLYPQILDVARNVQDDNLSSELQLIAELYKKVVELNNGYAYLTKAIANFVNIFLDDEDNPEQNAVEDLLNQVSKDIKNRAKASGLLGKTDSLSAVETLNQVKDSFNQRSIESEMSETESETEGLTQYEEGAVSTFDPTGGVGLEEGKTKGRGYFFQRVRSNKDWFQFFENEKQRLLDELPLERDKNIVSRIKKMIEILGPLQTALLEKQKLTDEVESHPELEPKLQQVNENISKLRKERNKLKSMLRSYLLKKQGEKLEEKLSLTTSEQEKFLLQQQIELNKLLTSKDLGKGEEIKLRKQLINAMSFGHSLGIETLKAMQQKIHMAAQKKKSWEQYNKELATKIRSTKQSGKLEGLIIDLQQKIATGKTIVKQSVSDKIERAESGIFKSFIDKINEAQSAGDKTAIATTRKELKKALSEHAEQQPEVQDYIVHRELFYNFRDAAKQIDKMGFVGRDDSDAQAFIEMLVKEGLKLITEYQNRKYFKPITDAVQRVVTFVQNPSNIEQVSEQPETSSENDQNQVNDSSGLGHQIFMELLRDLHIQGLDD